MNRQQRRAEKKQKSLERKVASQIVDKSKIRAEIDRMLKSDELVQQALQEEARRANLAEFKEQDTDLKALFLLSIRRSEGYGRNRLLRVASVLNEVLKEYAECYEQYDREAMRKHLKDETGIDVEHLDEEVAKYVAENTNKG